MSAIHASMHATAHDGGQKVVCVVTCDGRKAVVTFTPDEIITEVPEPHGGTRQAGD